MGLSLSSGLDHQHVKIVAIVIGLLVYLRFPTSSAFNFPSSLVCPHNRRSSVVSSRGLYVKRPQHVMSAIAPEHPDRVPSGPPKDGTFSIRGSLREIKSGIETSPDKAKIYEDLGGRTGGMWKTRYLGFIPATVSAVSEFHTHHKG